jgi:hypothetical protein
VEPDASIPEVSQDPAIPAEFSGLSSASLVVQNSCFDQDLNYTIRCTANTDCAIVNDVFSASVWVATQFENGAASFDCNRRPNGDLVGNEARGYPVDGRFIIPKGAFLCRQTS